MSAPAEAKGQSAAAVSAEVAVERWTRGALARATDQVAEEMPVALVYHDVPHVVMLATPADLEDYAVGFTLSEGLVAHTDEIRCPVTCSAMSHQWEPISARQRDGPLNLLSRRQFQSVS